ncbi:MAG: hypothetical protein Q8R86_09000 [Sulfuricurvum sp.]|nr:hypothetical protein [Sulfuricurvum sp.]
MENVQIDNVEARRSFLKKVAYVAPAVVVLGSLTLPSSAQASTFTHNTVDQNNPSVIASTQTVTTKDGTNIVMSGTDTPQPLLFPEDAKSLSGAKVKAYADAGNGTWAWVNSLFGGATKYFGV